MVFDERRPEISRRRFWGVCLVDAFSADYLRGSVVDFSDALTGGGFKITNPQAAQSCAAENLLKRSGGRCVQVKLSGHLPKDWARTNQKKGP